MSYVGPTCLSRSLVTGKAIEHQMHGLAVYGAGLGAIGRVVVAVGLENGMPPVYRCTARDLLAGPGRLQFFHARKHSPFLQSLVRIMMIDVPIA